MDVIVIEGRYLFWHMHSILPVFTSNFSTLSLSFISACRITMYCSKECQKMDWSRGHKHACKMYIQNTKPDLRPEGTGQRGPVAIGLYSVGLIDDDILGKAMCDYATCFLKEAKKVIKPNWSGQPKLSLVASVIYDMEKVRLVCAATFCHKETNKIVTVNHVQFEVVGEGDDGDVRRRLHPSHGGAGDIPDDIRANVITELYVFICQVNDHGISVQSITFGRGLMWLKDDKFQKGDKAKLMEEGNDENKIMWIPDTGYLIEESFSAMTGMGLF